ncbi:MAG: hypothetical protein DBX52_06495 [Clostridiales bacterium]|nr:MAG: hypothetical protein DBX52_06495 [Clostridiales bacterium]
MNDIIKKWLPEVKKYWFIPLMVAAGIFFMLQPAKEKNQQTVASVNMDQQFVSDTESRVAEMLKSVEGAGECRVTITLASGGKKEYVREEGNVLVITDKDGNQSAIVARESAPEIAGVTIASKGAGSVTVRNNIIESVSTVLGIGTNKICVVSMS